MTALYTCPHCGEQADTDPDVGSGLRQDYIEDCPVCCRPNRLSAVFEEDLDDFVVHATRET